MPQLNDKDADTTASEFKTIDVWIHLQRKDGEKMDNVIFGNFQTYMKRQEITYLEHLLENFKSDGILRMAKVSGLSSEKLIDKFEYYGLAKRTDFVRGYYRKINELA